MFKFPNETGNFCLICLHSACQALYNQCHLPSCQYTPPRNVISAVPEPYLRMDLAKPIWATKPEAYWSETVCYLKLPDNQTVVKPSAQFQTPTPSANW